MWNLLQTASLYFLVCDTSMCIVYSTGSPKNDNFMPFLKESCWFLQSYYYKLKYSDILCFVVTWLLHSVFYKNHRHLQLRLNLEQTQISFGHHFGYLKPPRLLKVKSGNSAFSQLWFSDRILGKLIRVWIKTKKKSNIIITCYYIFRVTLKLSYICLPKNFLLTYFPGYWTINLHQVLFQSLSNSPWKMVVVSL